MPGMRRSTRWLSRLAVAAVVGMALALAAGTTFAYRLMARVLSADASALPAPPPAARTDPLVIGYRGDPAAAFGVPFETVALATDLGPAPGWLIPGAAGRGDGRTAAVFVHGILGAREDGYAFVGPLHAAGVPVLLMTYRGDAEAPPDPLGLHAIGLTEWRDLDAAVALLAARGAERVIVVGASMGGGIVGAFLSRSPQAGRVAAVVLDAPALDFPAVLAALLSHIGLPAPRLVAPLAVAAFATLRGLDLGAAVHVAPVAAFPGPLVLMHGTADAIVPVSIADAVIAARSGLTLVVRSEAAHLGT